MYQLIIRLFAWRMGFRIGKHKMSSFRGSYSFISTALLFFLYLNHDIPYICTSSLDFVVFCCSCRQYRYILSTSIVRSQRLNVGYYWDAVTVVVKVLLLLSHRLDTQSPGSIDLSSIDCRFTSLKCLMINYFIPVGQLRSISWPKNQRITKKVRGLNDLEREIVKLPTVWIWSPRKVGNIHSKSIPIKTVRMGGFWDQKITFRNQTIDCLRNNTFLRPRGSWQYSLFILFLTSSKALYKPWCVNSDWISKVGCLFHWRDDDLQFAKRFQQTST